MTKTTRTDSCVYAGCCVYSAHILGREAVAIRNDSLKSPSVAVHGRNEALCEARPAERGRYAAVDLHCHSRHSDGALSVSELIDRAVERGLDWFSITDHDTLSGQAEAVAKAQAVGLNYVTGVEWSALWAGRSVHIVGLGFDPAHPKSLEAEQFQANARLQRARLIADRLEKNGFTGVHDWLQRQPPAQSVGRPHFADYLVASGQVRTVQQAFKRFLGAGKVGDVKMHWPDLADVVAWINGAGGVAVLAHPHRYRLTGRKRQLLQEAFADAGGRAMEIGMPGLDGNLRDQLVREAEKLGFLASSGSDFHSDQQHWLSIGSVPALPSPAQPVWEVL